MFNLNIAACTISYYSIGSNIEVFFRCECEWWSDDRDEWTASYCDDHGARTINHRGEVYDHLASN